MSPTAKTIDVGVPVLWLLGKSGAGKSALVNALTGIGGVGDGITATTRAARLIDYPAGAPSVRFLDTRGLGDSDLSTPQDVSLGVSSANAVLAVVRLDDTDQTALARVLATVNIPRLIVFTGLDLVRNADERTRLIAFHQSRLGGDLPFVSVGLPMDGLQTGVDGLLDALDTFMPHATAVLRKADEARAFAAVRPMILKYAAAAGASDMVPFAGLATVPATQGAMLHRLSRQYDVSLTPARLGVLASALGTGALVRMVAAHAARQGAKLVPVAGQTIGAAAAAGTSFATTYALGRAAAAWMYGLARGRPVDPASLRAIYEQSLKGAFGNESP